MKGRRTGLAGFIAIAYGLNRMTAAELLSFANLAMLNGYPGVAAVAMAEMKARAS